MNQLLLPLLALLQSAPQAQTPPEPDWAAALRQDARALHDDIAANHPGPVNPLDPGFAKRNDAGLALALERAARVHDRAGYIYALWGYAAGFDDGHLAVFGTDRLGVMSARWPGFLTGFDASGAQIVATREDRAPVPLGARLESCDGRPADRLAAENMGAFKGRWMLVSRRMLTGGDLFADYGNPFIVRPSRCTFRVGGAARTVTLDWQPIAPPALTERLRETSRRAHEPIGARTLADGTRWFTLSGFGGDPDGADARALAPLIAAMQADRDAIVKAPRIVLDLRGNDGGSSDWSNQIARILWGKGRVAALPDHSYVEWRASATNVGVLADYQKQFDRPETRDEIKRYFSIVLGGMRGALAAGRPLWREPEDLGEPPAGAPAAAPDPAPPAHVYFLTDTGCASACLDAADLWKALGAVQAGQETSADTLYMDVRHVTLPSGLAGAAIPMKVYRGRPRGANVPLQPVHRYAGDMRDTAALESWVATLRD